MPSTYTPNLRLELPATGELANTWGDHVNDNITSMIEQAVTDVMAVNVAGSGDTTLTSNNGISDQNRPARLQLTGARSAIGNVVVDSVDKWWFVENNTTGGFALTVKTSGGTGIAVPAGASMILYCDSTNVLNGINYLASLTLGSALPVASGGTGAITAALARASLGAAASGVNNDITSLTGLTTPLPISEGGTGQITAAAALAALGGMSTAGGTFTGAINLPAFSNLASATTTDLGSIDSNFILVTGNTTIASLGSAAAGTWRVVRFQSTLTLTYNASSLIIPTTANIAVGANDGIFAISLGSGNWYVVLYQRATGYPLKTPIVQGNTATYASMATLGGLTTQAHGLGATPTFLNCYLECLTTDQGYSVGDKISIPWLALGGGTSTTLLNVSFDATNVYIARNTTDPQWQVVNKSTRVTGSTTAASWKFVVIPFLVI